MDTRKESIDLNAYFPALDGIRFMAVSMVMFSHWVIYSQLKEFNAFLGEAGVNIFFTLSGFLICRILLVQKIQFRNKGLVLFKSFYARRMLRIFPLYYLLLIIGLVLAIPGARESFLRLALFVINIPDSNWILPSSGIYAHFWSLSAEEQFYIFLPLLFMVTPAKYLSRFFWLMIVVGILSRFYVYSTDISPYHKEAAAYTLTLCCFDSFGLGCILAWYFCCEPEKLKKIFASRILGVGCFFLFMVAGVYKMQFAEASAANLLSRFSVSLMGCWMIGSILYQRLPCWMYNFLLNPAVVYLGKISFGLYLIHPFVSWGIFKLNLQYTDFPFSILVYAVIYAVITIGLAALSWKYFEKPLNQLKSKFPYQGAANQFS